MQADTSSCCPKQAEEPKGCLGSVLPAWPEGTAGNQIHSTKSHPQAEFRAFCEKP